MSSIDSARRRASAGQPAAPQGALASTLPKVDGTFLINAGVTCALTASGLFCPQGPLIWYKALGVAFVAIASAVLLSAAVVTGLSERSANRLQGPRRAPAPIARELRDTAIAAWIAACLVAWALSRAFSGAPIGLVWDLNAAGGAAAVALQNLGALLVLDAWLYWKHRLLHTRLLFRFHREHHTFRDPTAFAGFAVGPVEAVLTFWPIALLAIPSATHYGPVYFTLVVSFVLLNLYLHCGVASRFIEAVLPRLFVNTSVHHNRHHARAGVNFSEAFTLWDHLCRTRERDHG